MFFAALVLYFVAAAAASSASARPNIVLILADDLDFDYKQDRLAIMPNLKRLREEGLHLVNHVAAQPVCGPSRSSLLAGRYPHNAGYIINDGKASIAAWTRAENNTLGAWLSAAGYYTSFLGKYVNSMESHVPAGWSRWHGFSSGEGTYNFYNATLYNVANTTTAAPPFAVEVMTGIHQSDFLGQYALRGVAEALAQAKPFYIQLNPVMVHWGTCYGPAPPGGYAPTDPHWDWTVPCPAGDPNCCPSTPAPGAPGHCAVPIDPCPSLATAHMFDGMKNPHVPAYNATESGPVPAFMRKMKPLTAWEMGRQDAGFRNRSSSAVDLDHMLGVVMDGLKTLGVAENTHVWFTSDNGYHLGEHSMVFGKGQPYETDVRLPFYAWGPGVPRNSTQAHPTTHVDIAATVVELAGATPVGEPLDGLSFASVLGAAPPPPQAWRNHSFSEFFGNADTWASLRSPLYSGWVRAKVNAWCTNDTEVFNLTADPWELANVAKGAGAAVLNSTLPLLSAMARCKGGLCRHPVPNGVEPLPCRSDAVAEDARLYDV